MEAPRLTPEAILEVEFREKLRGYNPEDVDRYLEQLASGVRTLHAELASAEQRAQAAEARADAPIDPESAAARTLVLAQRTADAALAEARAEADRIVQEALRDVNARREQAERETADEIQRLYALREQLAKEVEALQSWLVGEREKLRATLAETLAQLETAGPVFAPAPELSNVDLASLPSREPAFVPEPEPEQPAPAPEVAADPVLDLAQEDPLAPEDEAIVSANGEGDAFIAELRRAVVDDRPLGPREDDIVVSEGSDPFEEFIRYAADADEPRGLSSRLRRRR